MGKDATRARWERRPAWARTLRVAVFCAPVLASFGAAWAVRSHLPPATSLPGRAASLAVLVVVSTLVLLAVDRLGRRALPLATLLDLNMLFPDRAPSRLGMAREAIRRRPIEEQLRRVQEAGADPGAVAREILALVAALSAHDRPTRGHAERVRMFTDLLGEQMRIPARDRDLLRWAAILHDIGKLKVPASLLNKPAKPTADEWALLQAHPAHGAQMASALLPWLGEWGPVIVEHHERYDGSGYPNGLAGRQISLGARIVSVADAYDVMTAARAYKRPVSRAAACRELVRFSGSQFDPVVVRAMVAVGAPRLRRAQGVVAWLADIPLVATGSVPAATVARVVGAGALATGAVAGGVVIGDALDPPQRPAVTAVAVSEEGGGGVGRSSDSDGDRVADSAQDRAPDMNSPVRSSTPGAPPRPVGEQTAADTTASAGSATGSTAGSGDPSGKGGPGSSDRAEATDRTQTAEPSQPTDARAPSGSGPGSSGSGTDVLDDPVTDPVGTVTGTVDRAVDTVTGTVDDVVTDPVGTVEEVASDPVGTVTGTAGGLLGGGGSGSTPSPSPSPTSSGGGLLGGLLGR